MTSSQIYHNRGLTSGPNICLMSAIQTRDWYAKCSNLTIKILEQHASFHKRGSNQITGRVNLVERDLYHYFLVVDWNVVFLDDSVPKYKT